jgi:hypothetical protein
MYLREIEIVKFKEDIIDILRDIISMPEFVTRLFIEKGLIMFVLNLIFDFKYKHVIDKEIRGKLTDQALKIEHALLQDRSNLYGPSGLYSCGVLKAFIPPNFFAEINEQMRRNQYQPELFEKQMKFLDDFDADKFENVFVKWDCYLREESHKKVKDLCEKIMLGKPFDDLTALEEIVNVELEEELRISQVILRMYNRNPAVFINVKLNSFITDVAKEIQEVFMLFFRIRSREKKDIGDLTRKVDNVAQTTNL